MTGPENRFGVWAVSCAHVTKDKQFGLDSLARAIRQAEGREKGAPGFHWDIMLDAGDLTAGQHPPGDAEGEEVVRQYEALDRHRREQVYQVPGNHDACYADAEGFNWFRKWVDPMGECPGTSGVDAGQRPFPVEGTWERYCFQAGNILFLMLADRNDTLNPVGRGRVADRAWGGFPAGAVSRETFRWWRQKVLEHRDKILVTVHHHVLKDTTTGSSRGEGHPRYHGDSGGADGSAYLYYMIEEEVCGAFRYTEDTDAFSDFLESFQREHGKPAVDLWIGGHTHVVDPEDCGRDGFTPKTITEKKWGVTFLQVSALTRHHRMVPGHPLSRVLTFEQGADQVDLDVYLHTDAWEGRPGVGWYRQGTGHVSAPLRHRFRMPARAER